jgi:hypothetical protein
MGVIVAKRSVQFQKLAQIDQRGTPAQRALAHHAFAFLEENPVRVLGHSSEVFFGWIKPPTDPFKPDGDYYEKLRAHGFVEDQ